MMNDNSRSVRNGDICGPRTLRGNLALVRATGASTVRQARVQFRCLKRLCLPRNDSLQSLLPNI
jgi:hypothetical protein